MPIEAEEYYRFSPKPTNELTESDFELMAKVLNVQNKDLTLTTEAEVIITPQSLTFRQLGQIPLTYLDFNLEHTVTDIRSGKVLFVGPIRFQQLAMEHQHFEVFEVSEYGVSYFRLPLLQVDDKKLIALAYLGTEYKLRYA